MYRSSPHVLQALEWGVKVDRGEMIRDEPVVAQGGIGEGEKS
jgi:hypothetical protein